VISQHVAGDVGSIARRPMKSDGPGDTGERSKLVLYELDKVSEFEAVVVDPSWGSRAQHPINRSAPIQSPPLRHPTLSRSKIARGCHAGSLPISDAFPYFSNGDSFESVVTPAMKEACSAFNAF